MSLTSPCCATRDGRATWRLGGDNDNDDDDDDDAGLRQLARRGADQRAGRAVSSTMPIDATDELQLSPSRTRRMTGMDGIREIAEGMHGAERRRRAWRGSLVRPPLDCWWRGVGTCVLLAALLVRPQDRDVVGSVAGGRASLGCVVSGELRAGGQGEVLAVRHVRSSLGRGSWGDEAGDEVPSDDYGRGLWRSGCGLEN